MVSAIFKSRRDGRIIPTNFLSKGVGAGSCRSSRPFGTWITSNSGPNVETLGYFRVIPPGFETRSRASTDYLLVREGLQMITWQFIMPALCFRPLLLEVVP